MASTCRYARAPTASARAQAASSRGGPSRRARRRIPRQERVPLLRVGPAGEDRRHQGGGLRPDGLGPRDEPRGTPLPVLLVGLRHVGGQGGVLPAGHAPDMGRHPLAAMEDLDRHRRHPDVHPLVHQGMGHRGVVAVDLHVVVDVDARQLPLAVDEGRRRQGAERGPVEPLEELLAARLVAAHPPAVQGGEEFPDPGVQGRQRAERLVPEPGEDPPFRDLHGHFDFGLVPWLRRPGGEDRGAVVLGELFVGALQAGLGPGTGR